MRLLIFLLLSFCATLSAQTDSLNISFEDIKFRQLLLKKSAIVYLDNGRKMEGIITQIKADSLTLNVRNIINQQIATHKIVTIDMQVPKPQLAKGALLGGFAGFIVGAIQVIGSKLDVTRCDYIIAGNCKDRKQPSIGIPVLGGVLLGTAIGAGNRIRVTYILPRN